MKNRHYHREPRSPTNLLFLRLVVLRLSMVEQHEDFGYEERLRILKFLREYQLPRVLLLCLVRQLVGTSRCHAVAAKVYGTVDWLGAIEGDSWSMIYFLELKRWKREQNEWVN